MTTITRFTTLTLLAALTLIPALSAGASTPKAMFVAPGHQFQPLPRFGFHSHNVHGVGEHVTFVKWNSLARQFGLERGDMILALNNHALTFHGAWRHALREAMFQGGWIQLAIWDVRTGNVVYREMYLGSHGHGPITQKSGVAGHGPTTSHYVMGGGPTTMKSKAGSPKIGHPKSGQPKINIDLSKQLEKLVNKIKD